MLHVFGQYSWIEDSGKGKGGLFGKYRKIPPPVSVILSLPEKLL
jgi:hypothetical protein